MENFFFGALGVAVVLVALAAAVIAFAIARESWGRTP